MEVGGQKREDGRGETKVGRQKTEDGSWETEEKRGFDDL